MATKIKMLQAAAGAGGGFDPDTPIGTAIAGGYFAGIIVQGGDQYAIIVSPKASGQSSSLAFKTSGTASPTATQTLNYGSAATEAMVSAGSHPAAAFCAGLTIDGYSDWYLPARDELEVCYRNLKGTSAAVNSTITRDKSAITYPEGNDSSGDGMGVNRNSSPIGAAYTTSSPAQTSVTIFQQGQSQAFDTEPYHCSTEFSTTAPWVIDLNSGRCFTFFGKTQVLRVRAVRREPV